MPSRQPGGHAAKAIETRTIAGVSLSLANNAALVPVNNKNDLSSAIPGRVKAELKRMERHRRSPSL